MALAAPGLAPGGGRMTDAPSLRSGEDGRARLRDLLPRARAYRLQLGAAAALSLLGTAATLAQPLLIATTLRAISGQGSPTQPVTVLVVVFVAGATAGAARTYLLGWIGEALVRDLRVQLAEHLLVLPVAVHDHLRAGDLLSRVSTDTATLRAALTSGPVNAVTGVLTMAGAIVLMSTLDAWLLLLTLGAVAVAGLALGLVIPRARSAGAEAQASIGALTSVLERALRAIRTIKASRAEPREAAGIRAAAGRAFTAGVRIERIQATIDPTVTVAVQGSFLVVLGVGGARVAAGSLEIADLVAFLLYLTTLVVPLVAVLTFLNETQAALAAFARIQDVLREPAEDLGRPGPSVVRDEGHGGAARVQFDQVTFGYRSRQPVLRGVSFVVPPGSRTAVVGPSGAGKTTLLSLLERFYDADSGVVRLDGRDVGELTLAQVRAATAYVEQDAPVLAGTLRENLLLAAPDATEGQLDDVLHRTMLLGLVQRLPDALDSQVGDSGVLLSGGERQRIAIARALLTHPRLLLLDEATSQLDALNEQALRETVRRVAGRHCTVIIVAHRLSTVRDADQIVLLDRGRVVGTGSHELLLARSDLYQRLVRGQLASSDTTAARATAGHA